MQITILPGAAGTKPMLFTRLAAVAALLLHSGTAASRVEFSKADLILPSHRAYSALLISNIQPAMLA